MHQLGKRSYQKNFKIVKTYWIYHFDEKIKHFWLYFLTLLRRKKYALTTEIKTNKNHHGDKRFLFALILLCIKEMSFFYQAMIMEGYCQVVAYICRGLGNEMCLNFFLFEARICYNASLFESKNVHREDWKTKDLCKPVVKITY